METTARFLAMPENRSALAAVQGVLFGVMQDAADRLPNPLFLHGPSGVGKTTLVATLAESLTDAGCDVCVLSGNDFADQDDFTGARQADLLIIEDLQHVPVRFFATLIDLLDGRRHHGMATVVTAIAGPARLTHRGVALPNRVISRLAAGLVVALEPTQAPSRRRLLEGLAARAKLNVSAEILDWLARQLSSGRQLHGAIRQLELLQSEQAKPLCLNEIESHFDARIIPGAPTVRRIADHVSRHYRVAPKRVLSARRGRDVLVPRQVSMYLARQLTNQSLKSIGQYFGGRDHKTVQHACRKVENAMKTDASLDGVIRHMCAELG